MAPPPISSLPPPPTAPPISSAPPPAGGAYAPPGGTFNYQGGALQPAAPQPTSLPPGLQPEPIAGEHSGRERSAASYAPPPSSSTQFSPAAQFVPPVVPIEEAPESVNDRAAIAKEVRPLAETSSRTRLANAAGTSTWNEDTEPSEQYLEPPQDLAEIPEARPLRDPRDTRDVEPASYNVPRGAPVRLAKGSSAREHQRRTMLKILSLSLATPNRLPPATDRPTTVPHTGTTTNTPGCKDNWSTHRLRSDGSLRYIPIDGLTDRYGGSVVLAPTQQLAGLRPGSFRCGQGQVDTSTAPQGTYSPIYRVASIQRLSD